MDGPSDLNRLVSEARADLEAVGLHAAAAQLRAIQESAFTTGSEWLGDLGLAVGRMRREGGIPRSIDAKLESIMAEVRRAWPKL